MRKPSPSPVETEAKIRVSSLLVIRRRIASAGGRLRSGRALETNTLFDSASRGLAAAGKSLRVRRYGEEGLVTLKGAARVKGGLKSRLELEARVDSSETVAEILTSLGFLPLFRYEKFREVWNLGGAEICLDDTPLGRFVEIEGSPKGIREAAALLELDQSEFLTASYPALWLAAARKGDMVFAPKARAAGGRA